MKKVGIIRCQQTEDYCPGTTDFKVARAGKGVFKNTGPVEIIGFVSCGGCPGKKIVHRAEILQKRGADIIVMASCIKKGNPIGFECPNFEKIKAVLEDKFSLNSNIEILDWTH